ncbi:hypothetical protein DFH07DRAFT_770267 [Mycena maculata]|uniref:ER membrane protein complex subunit 10 n=1 Tax=Mycena maculata TaxID=230809 RepID=A0AAD7JHP9_9AGAR|nr:hypothetical protein DFH07DRAFT_770267 [Mycena maculata]
MILLSLLATIYLVSAADSSFQVYHRLYEPNQPETQFIPRGTIVIPGNGHALFEPSPSLSQELTQFADELQNVKGAMYQVALERDGDVIARQWDTSAVKVCHLNQATSETFILHTSHEGQPYALDYFVAPSPHNGACPKKAKAEPAPLRSFAGNIDNLNTTLVVRSTRLPPLPDLRVPPPLTPEGAPVVPVPEKSLFQKYWMYGAAILIALMMSGGGEEEPKK